MTSHIPPTRHWPRLETAEQLAARLNRVRPRRWRHYRYIAEPPCHDSRSGESFQFGDHPQGGLTVTCWACQTPGARGWLDRLERILGAELQVRYENGALRYPPTGGARPAPPPRHPPPEGAPAVYRPQATMAELKAAPLWLAARGQGPWQGAARENGRLVTQAYRQSLRDEDAPDGNGLKLAREGGIINLKYPHPPDAAIRLRPWQTLAEVQEFIAGLGPVPGLRPAIALAGDVRHPAPLGLLALDCDYDPARDPDGAAARLRDELRRRCAAAGAPVFESSGSHGFHALFTLEPETGPQYPRQNRQWPAKVQGITVETFLSGARRMLTVRVDKPLANAADENPLPAITPRRAAELVRKALE